MSSIEVGSIVFVLLAGSTMLGISLRAFLPERHLAADSKDSIRVAMGLVATMTALVLGLLVASAKSSYDAQSTELTDMSAKIMLLDRVLAHYGPEAKEARDLLRGSVTGALDQIWSKDRSVSELSPQAAGGEVLFDKIQGLSPKDDGERSLQSQALSLALSIGQIRWLMYEQATSSISLPFLIVVLFWLTALFLSFGLFAPLNATVVASFFVAALSVGAALFLIVEMYKPYTGLIQISSTPLRTALAHLGQ